MSAVNRGQFRFSETKVISSDCVTYVDASNTFSGSSYKVFHGLMISSCSGWRKCLGGKEERE
jgi:hypothetical protein